MFFLIFEDWGLIDYESALKKQLEYVDQVAADDNHAGFLVFCTHPAVVTTGRQTKPEDIFAWQGPVIEISRGGQATYHGPSQVVVYPIINLKKPRADRGAQEIRGYLRDFEKAIVETLKHFLVPAEGNQTDKVEDTGVWIETPTGLKKMASLGIAVKKWTTYHGAAINLYDDASAFQGINPCGYKTDTMISLEKFLNKKIKAEEFKLRLRSELERYL
ncbi:MAG: lipoyl(octanoyl) transferase LipB [Bdellovibrionaceae bacterium]|nr:lipoyl(octanoyl) transferase LipB [Pseudobdellovibrionaceae bacterium]